MKITQISKQTYQVGSDFSLDTTMAAVKATLADKAFTQLIQGEKHSLTLDFIISVNEVETHELDRRLLDALKVVKELQNITIEKADAPQTYDLLSLWFSSRHVDTSLLDKHNVPLPEPDGYVKLADVERLIHENMFNGDSILRADMLLNQIKGLNKPDNMQKLVQHIDAVIAKEKE